MRITVIVVSILILIVLPFIFLLIRNPTYDQIKKISGTGRNISKNDLSPKTNLHHIIDWLPRLFPDAQPFPNGVQTASFIEHIDAVRFKIPEWKGKGLYEVVAHTAEGIMNPAFLVYHWYADNAPTIIFNHGAFEHPFDNTFRQIFKKGSLETLKINLIMLRTPYHEQKGELNNGIMTLSKFMATMAVSTKLTEELLKAVKEKGVKIVEVAGISLGGVIGNRHRTIYNSADYYIPIIAGTAHEKLFIKKSVTQHEIERNNVISKNLNFTADWNRVHTNNVFPIMARYDDYCKLSEQGPSYGHCQIEIWDLGHLTASLSHKALNFVLLRHLTTEKNE